MCGRFVVAGERRDLLGLFEVEIEADDLPPKSWNVRPTDPIAIVLDSVKKTASGRSPDESTRVRRLESARWSLTPSFSKTLAMRGPTFNARSETAATKSMFASAVKSKRAIIPASGYYEWKTQGKTKTPFYIHPGPGGAGEDTIAFAGLYSWWRDAARADDDPARWVLTATILTMDAMGPLRDIHDRTPVTLPRSWWDDWLDPSIEGDQTMVDAAVSASVAEAQQLRVHEVAPVRGDDRAGLINPL